jgi:hypothetical protein
VTGSRGNYATARMASVWRRRQPACVSDTWPVDWSPKLVGLPENGGRIMGADVTGKDVLDFQGRKLQNSNIGMQSPYINIQDRHQEPDKMLLILMNHLASRSTTNKSRGSPPHPDCVLVLAPGCSLLDRLRTHRDCGATRPLLLRCSFHHSN